jgi:hypothetical protein
MNAVASVKLDGSAPPHQQVPGKSLAEGRVTSVLKGPLDLSKFKMDTTRRFSMKSLVDLVNSEPLFREKK